MRKNYAVKGLERDIKHAFEEFVDLRNSDGKKPEEIKNYNTLIQSSTDVGSRLLERMKIIIGWLNKKINIKELDPDRLFTKKQKLSIYHREKGKCQNIHCRLKGKEINFNLSECHHEKQYIFGGKTKTNKGILLCKRCHKLIHSKKRESVEIRK